MSKIVKGPIDEIVKSVMHEMFPPYNEDTEMYNSLSTTIRTSIDKFVVKKLESCEPRYICPTCHQPTPINPNLDIEAMNKFTPTKKGETPQ